MQQASPDGKGIADMTRHEMRKSAFMLIFERIFSNDDPKEMVAIAKENDLIAVSSQTERLFYGVEQNKQELDGIIEKRLNKWSIDRISKVSLAVLRLAIYEMKYEDDISDEIAISEAVKIAQIYTVKEDVTFVNGILASISRNQ